MRTYEKGVRAKEITITVLLIIVPAAALAWMRTLMDADEAFLDNFLTFMALAAIVYTVSALLESRKGKS